MPEAPLPAPTHGEGTFIRQQGPPGRYGHVKLLIEASGTSGVTLVWQVDAAQIPVKYEAAVRKGVEEWFLHIRAADRLDHQGLLVRIVGGSHHETDSNETSYTIAAALAVKDAFEKFDLT